MMLGGLALALLLIALAMIRPRSIDESQYIAATALAVRHLPYRDFAYFQTPLQPILYSILALLFPSWQFVASRLANALCGAGSVLLVGLALRRAGVASRPAIIASLLFLSCDAALFSFAVARNDALPTLLLSAALAAIAGPRSARSVFLAGLFIGGAAAAKISFALPAATLLILAAVGPASVRARLPLRWLAVGLALPIAFVAFFAAISPGAFLFDNFIYPVKAPREWYHLIGRDWKTGWGHPVGFIKYLLEGPAMAALIVIGIAAWRKRGSPVAANPLPFLFAALAVAGLIAAYLPNPARLPYLMPLLPPLFVCLGLVFAAYPALLRKSGLLWGIFAAVGLFHSAQAAALAVSKQRIVAFKVEQDAHRLGKLLDRAGVSGPIAGLSPEAFADSGRPIDPRFAAGPFAFRMVALTNADQDRAWHIISAASLDQLRSSPPAAFVVDLSQSRKYGADLNGVLTRTARSAGFAPVAKVDKLELWLPVKQPPAR